MNKSIIDKLQKRCNNIGPFDTTIVYSVIYNGIIYTSAFLSGMPSNDNFNTFLLEHDFKRESYSVPFTSVRELRLAMLVTAGKREISSFTHAYCILPSDLVLTYFLVGRDEY